MLTWIGAGLLCMIALVHSVLGERDIVTPLCAASWQIDGTPRAAVQQLIRSVWHMLSVAWVCLAATLLGLSPAYAMALCAGFASLALFVTLREHFAWPLLALVAIFALHGAGALPSWAVLGLMVAAITVSALTGALHVYWALGGRWGIEAALPERSDGKRSFMPPTWMTLLVALALWSFAALLAAALAWGPLLWLKVLLLIAAIVLALRAVGDGSQVGLSKRRDHITAFSRMDDALFTPLVIGMASAAASIWLL